MVGFIKGLFGSKKDKADGVEAAKPEKKSPERKSVDKPAKPAKVKPAKTARPARSSKDYFLDSDAAKTVSNMPKSTDLASILEKGNQPRSATESRIMPSAEPSQPSKPQLETRKPDGSLDEFRKMARDIKK